MKKPTLLEIQKKLNEELAITLEFEGIKNVRLTSLGNSIASGYSMVRTIKPLLLRNETIEEIFGQANLELERYNFARAQNNNDEHIFSWICRNIKESEINDMCFNDFFPGPTSMPNKGITYDELKEYYPSDFEGKIDNGLRDIILSNEENMANIVIYNGCTGSFLDNVTRNGKLHQMLTYGIKRDTKGLEATLKLIQSSNRYDGTNTQVYICGAPNFLGLNIVELINGKLKKIAKQYANVTYVEPVKAKFIYPKHKDIGYGIDIHYSEEEYQQLNNNILKSIIGNYQINQAMINVDRDLHGLSTYVELDEQWLLKDKETLSEKIEKIIKKQRIDSDKKEQFHNRAKKYLIEKAPYDFYYLGKENMKKSLEKTLIKEHK